MLLTEEMIERLFESAKENNESLCEKCLDDERRKQYREVFERDFWYVFDMGRCDRCSELNEIVYLPIADFLLGDNNITPKQWFEALPVTKEAIEYQQTLMKFKD